MYETNPHLKVIEERSRDVQIRHLRGPIVHLDVNVGVCTEVLSTKLVGEV